MGVVLWNDTDDHDDPYEDDYGQCKHCHTPFHADSDPILNEFCDSDCVDMYELINGYGCSPSEAREHIRNLTWPTTLIKDD